jgi:hypothetical protein
MGEFLNINLGMIAVVHHRIITELPQLKLRKNKNKANNFKKHMGLSYIIRISGCPHTT